ncbi:MAG: dihydropteroate synthase [Flavobacteriales bacterium]
MHNSFTLNIHGTLKTIDKPWVMGILNVTPDSFYEGSRITGVEAALAKAESMLEEGADCLDIGGYSSRPGADEVSENEELARVIPVIEAVHHRFPEAIISIDTFRSQVAREAVNAGASIINDISGGEADKLMFSAVKELNVPYILMHMAGNPKTMQNSPSYKNVVTEVYTSLSKRVQKLRQLGVADVIVDPGFGFGKTIEHNYALLKGMAYFQSLNCPILVGLSRKSMIYKSLNINPEESLNGTSVLNTYALELGAQILRVHDVKEAKQVVDLYSLMNLE